MPRNTRFWLAFALIAPIAFAVSPWGGYFVRVLVSTVVGVVAGIGTQPLRVSDARLAAALWPAWGVAVVLWVVQL